jgi:hypothetical protein
MNELSALLEEKMDIYGHFGLQLMIWCSRGGVKSRFHGNSELLKAGRTFGLTYVCP